MEKQIEIYIEWSGPFTQNEVRDNKGGNKGGLYQIYGYHPVYGDNALLYIGKTDDSFENRLYEGRGILTYNNDIKNLEIYLGKLFYDDIYYKPSETEQKNNLEYAETLLINWHSPALNSSNINTFKHGDKSIRIINTDSYRKLVPELSTAAIYQDYKIKNQIQELANEIQEFNKFELYDEDDGYGFWLTDELWFGVDYNLWGNNTLLVVMTQNKTLLLNSHEVPQNNKKEDEDWCYISIQGNREQIIKQIRKLLGN